MERIKNFDEIQAIIAKKLSSIDWKKEPIGLYEPIEYILSLGGKKVRPALALMACNLFSENIEEAVDPAIGIEIFHNFTLLHDDIMDKAEIRRGKPTVHIKWNENTAILSGDIMQITAYQYIAETKGSVLKPVLDVFSRVAAQVCEGQQYDMDFETRDDVTIDEYIEMIRLKTAVLLGGACEIGALVAGADAGDAELLYDFGVEIGLAFQLRDDFLDSYGDPKVFGKKIGGDILCNKKTFLQLTALNNAKGKTLENLKEAIKVSPDFPEKKIKAVIAVYDELDVRKTCEEAILAYYKRAVSKLEQIAVPDTRKQELRNLAHKMMLRKE